MPGIELPGLRPPIIVKTIILGGSRLEQRGEFYELGAIWVARTSSLNLIDQQTVRASG